MATPPQRASHQARAARVSRRPPSFAVTLVALAIVFALAWMFFLRSSPSASAPVVNGIQGSYTWETKQGGGQTGTFSAVAGGNAGGQAESSTVTLGGQPPVSAYSAPSRTESTLVRKAVPTEVRTVGEWPPAWRVATRSPLDYQGLAAVVRTAVEDGDEAVGIKPLKDGDRAVWRAAVTMDGKQIDVVVDQQSGIVTWYSDGEDTFTAEVDWDSPPPADSTYTVDAPAGTDLKTVEADAYTYLASPAAGGRTAGYSPLASDLAPDGYALRAVATTHDAYRPLAWFGLAGDPPIAPTFREDVVVGLYTRGLSWFTAEQIGPKATRFVASSLQEWVGSSDERLSLQQTTLQYGALKGATAYTWYQESGPSLFVATERRAIFVTGALTRQELIALAEGLRPAP
jgi:hypothetical protein